MASQIRYKFMHSRDSSTLLFDGVSLSLEALKRAIIEREHLQASGMDLVVMDTAGNGEPRV